MNGTRLENASSDYGDARDQPGYTDIGLANMHANSNQYFIEQVSRPPLLALRSPSSQDRH
jgi:hypothetical protein